MNRPRSRFALALAALTAALGFVGSAYAVPFASTYSENFNGMGTGTTPPAGWSLKVGDAGGNNTWVTSIAASGAASVATMIATPAALSVSAAPSSTNNNSYNSQVPGVAADRLIATSPTGITGTAIELVLTNTTGGPVNAIKIGYDIRRFTAVSSANELPGYWLFYSLNGTTWTNVSALNPALTGATVNVPNTVGVTTVAPTLVTLSGAWANGANLQLRWIDDNAVATSPDQIVGLDNVTVALPVVGVPPTVAITSPTTGSSLPLPGPVEITADANDTDGTIAKVEFFQGTTKLGEDITAPYSFTWSGVAPGNYALTVVATDNDENVVTSAAVNFTVTNQAPTATLLAPTAGTTYDAPASISFLADASDADGTVARVEFYQGTTKLGEDTSAPYSFDWTSVPSGSYSLTAKAIDNFGAAGTSAAVDVTVTNSDNVAPTVAISSPANGATLAISGTTTIVASASDTDGVVSKVEFFVDNAKIGEDTVAPFAFDWTNVPAGAHTLHAIATDNNGAHATSVTVSVTAAATPIDYAQDFNGMATGTTAPAGWQFFGNFGGENVTWTNTTGIPASAAGNGTANATLIASSTFSSNSNTQGFNFALSGSPTDRALGTAPTTGAGVALQYTLVNTTGAALPSIRIGYDIRRFTAATANNELPGYLLFYSIDNGAWVDVSALNPALSGGAVNVPNTTGVTTVPLTSIPFSAPWAAGATLRFRWLDDNAADTSPDQIIGLDNVVIAPPVGAVPSAELTAPVAGATFQGGNTIALAANASDTDGTIARVEFYRGSTEIGEDSSAPFTFNWLNVTAGSYTLTAVAIDNDGNATISAPVAITVTAPPSGTLARGPYLQKAAPTQMTVRWRSTQSIAGRVRYGSSPDNLDQFADEPAAAIDHVVTLSGLSPYTTYYYSIGSALDMLASGVDYTFRTPPVAGTVLPIRVWSLGDAGTANSNQRAVRDAFYTWTGARTPDLVLQLGDNAYNAGLDNEFQAAVFDMYPTMLRKTPFWSALGNHETAQATAFVDTYPYFDIYTFPTAGESGGVPSGTEHYYSFDYGNVHFISIDSMTASRSPTGAMATWLQNDLASTTATWVIAFFHHPPYTKGSHNSDSESELVQMRQNIVPILEAGGVDLVLSGHSHSYERTYLIDGHYGLSTTFTNAMKVDGGNGGQPTANLITRFGTVAGTGAYVKPLTGPRDHLGTIYSVPGSSGQTSGGSLNHAAHLISLNNLGSLVLDIEGNRLDATFLRENGTTPDTFTIVKQGAADRDGDGLSDEYEIANGLDRNNATDADLDLDGDGLSNRAEFALGTAANVPGRNGLPTLGTDAGKLMLTFNRARAELTYIVQASDDLKTWTDLATNPGSAGGSVTVTDTNTTSPNRFLRLRITDGVSAINLTPSGRITYALTANQEAALAFPLTPAIGASITGQPAGFITGVGANTLDNSNAGWTPGQLSQPGTPYLVRIASGPAAGLVFPVATDVTGQNTATRLTLVTDGINLATLGITPGVTAYELIPADTLGSLFPAGTLATGDVFRTWTNGAWVNYTFDGAHWLASGVPADDLVVRPDQGYALQRRGAAKSFALLGEVSSTDARVFVARSGSTNVSLLPLQQTFAEFSLQTLMPGWTSNSANPTAGDYVRLWNGSTWLNFYFNGTKWMRQGAGDASTTVLLKPGRPFFIVRPSGAGSDILTHTKTY